jgi:hypothetical protein
MFYRSRVSDSLMPIVIAGQRGQVDGERSLMTLGLWKDSAPGGAGCLPIDTDPSSVSSSVSARPVTLGRTARFVGFFVSPRAFVSRCSFGIAALPGTFHLYRAFDIQQIRYLIGFGVILRSDSHQDFAGANLLLVVRRVRLWNAHIGKSAQKRTRRLDDRGTSARAASLLPGCAVIRSAIEQLDLVPGNMVFS